MYKKVVKYYNDGISEQYFLLKNNEEGLEIANSDRILKKQKIILDESTFNLSVVKDYSQLLAIFNRAVVESDLEEIINVFCLEMDSNRVLPSSKYHCQQSNTVVVNVILKDSELLSIEESEQCLRESIKFSLLNNLSYFDSYLIIQELKVFKFNISYLVNRISLNKVEYLNTYFNTKYKNLLISIKVAKVNNNDRILITGKWLTYYDYNIELKKFIILYGYKLEIILTDEVINLLFRNEEYLVESLNIQFFS